jgi:Ca2+-transporting ATPase
MRTAEAGQNNIYNGTLVVQGKAIAQVLETGLRTRFGQIGKSLQSIEPDETRLQKEMKVLIRRLAIIGVLISISIILIYYLTRGNFIQSLLNGLAASMAILPEEFPVVLTVFLALGAWRLSKKNVLTRKPTAIETLGSATVLCSDKTGTITQNQMEIAMVYDGQTLFEKNIFEKNIAQIDELICTAQRASQNNPVDPMEKAIGRIYSDLLSRSGETRLLKEYPLSKELLAMTRVLEEVSENALSVSAKGAPEAIFQLCKLNETEIKKHQAVLHQMAEQGYRVIAVAKAMHRETELPEKQHEFDFTFLGLIGLEDPIRPEVPQAIRECLEAGVKVIMITGDYPATARSIALQAGLPASGEVISGDDLTSMSEAELAEKIKRTNIFARVIPEQKLRIVQALKANGEIVAMTGDGVNDAPALKAAHIGVAMGNKGTDVAREAASLVLLDDNFASIVSAIRLGRRIFDNLQKAMSYILAIHIPIIGLTLMPAFIPSLPLLLLPLHIVFMELIIDPICSVAFESEQDEKGIMQRPPRIPDAQFFGIKNILLSLLNGLLLLAMVVTLYFLSIREGHTEGEVRAIAFSALIVGNIFLILASMSASRSFVSVFIEKNIAAIVILLTALILLLLVIYIPVLQQIFKFDNPGFRHFIPSLAGAVSLLIILELIKYFRNRKATSANSINT